MLEASAPSLLAENRPGRLGLLLGRMLAMLYRLTGRHRYDDFRLERVLDVPILVMPTVANPKVLRTGAFFAAQLDDRVVSADDEVLDLGTGSGVCALFVARRARRVVATDISPAAVRCARINSLINGVDERIDIRQGDMFAPVAGERFDLVLFNPPFLLGEPEGERDLAWRSADAAERFAAGLPAHLNPGGTALLLLSTFGDACNRFESELALHGFRLEVFARRRFVNETVTIVRATRGGSG